MEKLEQKIDELHKIIQDKEKIIDQLANDVQNLKSVVDELKEDFETNDENATLQENVSEVYDEETADRKGKDFITKNLEHLDNMEKEIEKSRKNLRIKFKNFYDKMEAEIENFNLIPRSI